MKGRPARFGFTRFCSSSTRMHSLVPPSDPGLRDPPLHGPPTNAVIENIRDHSTITEQLLPIILLLRAGSPQLIYLPVHGGALSRIGGRVGAVERLKRGWGIESTIGSDRASPDKRTREGTKQRPYPTVGKGGRHS